MPVFDPDDNKHPAGYRDREGTKKCYTCAAYGFEPGGVDTWAYCYLHRKWFPNPRDWVKGFGVPPGERTCKHWVEKFERATKGGAKEKL